jgi:hypothetical protein
VQVSHTFTPQSAVFDEENLVSCAGLVPVMALAEQAGLSDLLANKIDIAAPRVKSGSANPAPKLATLIASMCAGADYVDDVDLVRAGGMKTLFHRVYAPSTVGTLLREFTFGHARQLDSVLAEHLAGHAHQHGGSVDGHVGRGDPANGERGEVEIGHVGDGGPRHVLLLSRARVGACVGRASRPGTNYAALAGMLRLTGRDTPCHARGLSGDPLWHGSGTEADTEVRNGLCAAYSPKSTAASTASTSVPRSPASGASLTKNCWRWATIRTPPASPTSTS